MQLEQATLDADDDDMGFALCDSDRDEASPSVQAEESVQSAPMSAPKRGGRTKQTARKSTGGKAPRLHLLAKAVSVDSDESEGDDGALLGQAEFKLAPKVAFGKVHTDVMSVVCC